ncbi:hypothetical protein [Microterricola pindariensis]|uniref:hypothetical protein n=1 Tax=Microterricola pindariensis TaxID=478010 RepID=UPI001057362C|nr:hypothetical protein [Microterricola pindariensis]
MNRPLADDRVHKCTVMLDSNVWRYLVDAEAVEDLRMVSRSAEVRIVACPAVAFEVLRMPNSALKRKLVKAITLGEWERPMPEVFHESESMRAAIHAHRPEWLIEHPDLRHWHELRADWQSGWWRRARTDSKAESARIDQLGGDDLRRAREAAHFFRKDAIDAKRTFGSVNVDDVPVVFEAPVFGWDGKPFEAWRADGITTWWREFVENDDSACSDWLGPWVDRRAIAEDRGSWHSFWTREVSMSELPFHWLRWALDYVQRTRRTTDGTPVDNQIGTYLAACDIFVSGDRALLDCIEKVRHGSPSALAKSQLVSAGSQGVAELFSAIRNLGAVTELS